MIALFASETRRPSLMSPPLGSARSYDEGLRPSQSPPEARDVERREVEGRLASRDQLRDMLPDRRRLLETVAGEPRRIEEPRRLCRLADERVPIRADLVVAPPRGLHRQVGEHRQPPRRRLGELLERLLPPPEHEPRPLAMEVERG